MDEEENSNFLANFFGRDPLKIPCFRNTFLYSISSYVGVSLLTFLLTSRPQFSSHVGMASFTVVSLGYYSVCRYKFAKDAYDAKRLQEYLHAAVVMEGSEEWNEKKIPPLDEA